MLYRKKNIDDIDNRIILNCGGHRHETYKVAMIRWLRIPKHNSFTDDIEEDTSHKTVKAYRGIGKLWPHSKWILLWQVSSLSNSLTHSSDPPDTRRCLPRCSTITARASCTTPTACAGPCLRRSWSTGAWTVTWWTKTVSWYHGADNLL